MFEILRVIFWLAVTYLGFMLILGQLFKNEIKAIFDRDPAAVSYLEVLLTYSGLHAIIAYRIGHRLLKAKVPFFPRFISQVAKLFTGIEIHPGAEIGNGLFIDHGTGVVIGETCIIGNNVTVFQGVTLGGTGKETGKRHPTINDNVVVGAGAKVLGNITLGDCVNVGANAVVVKDVPPQSTVVGIPGRIVRKQGKRTNAINLDHAKLPDPIMQSLARLEKEIHLIEHEIKEHHKDANL